MPEQMKISVRDADILRHLAERKAKIADLPIQKQRKDMWTRLNRLEKVRPLVWLNEVPWHEMNVNDELTLQTSDKFCQNLEWQLRRELYQWDHMQGDMVVEATICLPLVIHDTGFGIREEARVIQQDEKSSIVSREFHPQIREEKDLEKIKTPVLTYDQEASERNYHMLVDMIGDILSVKKSGIVHSWFAPWDELIRWWNVQEALMDMVLRPELVHRAMNRLINAYLSRLDQWERLNVLSVREGNYRVGSGGYAYTDKLPQPDFNPQHVRTIDQWGCATAQIFSDVSPEMHWEFALQYEMRWLERFGLNYYGCCEPLHNKLEILKRVPRLRKISCSPWMNVSKAVEEMRGRYVFSLKPNPACLAEDNWRPGLAQKELETKLDLMRGCPVEIIMKDISTVRYEPKRLWEWAKIALETAEKFA